MPYPCEVISQDGVLIVVREQTKDGRIVKAQSADGRYRWSNAQPDYLQDTVLGRSVYQDRYLRTEEFGSDPIPADTFAEIVTLRYAIDSLVTERQEAADSARLDAQIAEAAEQEAFYGRMVSNLRGWGE